MKLTNIEEMFLDVAFLCGGVFLLRPADAVRFVEEHLAAGVPILGIEGFRSVAEGKIQPLQEHTIDFDEEAVSTHQQAIRFLEERLNLGLWFEVVGADR